MQESGTFDELLIELDASDAKTRTFAAHAMCEIAKNNPAMVRPAIDLLLRGLKDDSGAVRWEALNTLAVMGCALPQEIIPLLLNKETIGIIELASFHALDEETEWTFKNLSKIIGNAIVTKIKSAEKK